jgi:hypothetical protein
MNSEYDEFIKDFNSTIDRLYEDENQLPIVFDKIFSKSNLIEECRVYHENEDDYNNINDESSKYNFDDYLKDIFKQLEKFSPSRFEYCCKCMLNELLNQEISPELKQLFYQHIIAWLSFMQQKIGEEVNKSDNNLNKNEIISALMDIYETGITELWTPIRLSCGKFLTPVIYKYIKIINSKDYQPTLIMNKLMTILNNRAIQWQKYEGSVNGIYNLLLIQEFVNSLLDKDIHNLIEILFNKVISSQPSIRDWCMRSISIIFSKKGKSDELKNLLMETLKHLQPVNWASISNDTEIYSPCTPKSPEESYFQYNKCTKLPLLLNGSIDFTNYSCTLNCDKSHFDMDIEDSMNLNSQLRVQSNNSNASSTTGENYAIELDIKMMYNPLPKNEEKACSEKPVLSPNQQQSLGLTSLECNSNSMCSLASPSTSTKYSVTPIINHCELQFPIHSGKSTIHQIEGLILLLEFLVRFIDSLDVNIFNSVFNISKYYLGHMNINIRQSASSLIKTLVINHNENHEINILFIINSLAAEWPIRGPLCSTKNTTEDNIPWEWKEGRLYVFEQLFRFLNNQQLHFITPTVLKNSEGISVKPGGPLKERVLSLSKTNLKYIDTSMDSDLDESPSQENLGKNTQSLDQLINIELLKNYDSLLNTNSTYFPPQKIPISHDYNSNSDIKMIENLDLNSSTFSTTHLTKIKTNTEFHDNYSFYSRIRKIIPPHSNITPNSPQVSGSSLKHSFGQKYATLAAFHYSNNQHNMINSGNNLSMRYKLQSIVRSGNTKLNEPMYLKKNLNEFSNLQFHQQIMKILTYIFIQSTFESYNDKRGELKFVSNHLIPVITEALLWVDVETSVQLIRDIINGFIDPRSTIIDKNSDSQKYILGLVLKALIMKAISLSELNRKRKDDDSGEDTALSFGSSGAMFGGNNYESSSSSSSSESGEWAYVEKIIEQIKSAIPDIVNFTYSMIDTMSSNNTMTLSCEILMLIRTHFRSNLVAQKSQMKRRFGSNFGLYETESEPCSMRRGLTATLSYVLVLFKDITCHQGNDNYLRDKLNLRTNENNFSMENYEKWKNFVNTVIKNPEELNITPLWKKEVINTTSSLWKCFINDLSAYEMLFFMPFLIDYMGESLNHQLVYLSAINQVLLRWGKLLQKDPTINQLIISKFKSEDSDNTWNEDDDCEELSQSDWSEGMDKICIQCIDELNLLVKYKNFTKKSLFVIVNTMYICCLVMNTHLQKDAIKKIFSTLTMLMKNYEKQKRISTASPNKEDYDMDKIFTETLDKANSSINFSNMNILQEKDSVFEEGDLSYTPIIVNDIIKKLDHLSTVLDKHRSNNDIVNVGLNNEKDEANSIHQYFDSLLIDAVKENPTIGNKLSR